MRMYVWERGRMGDVYNKKSCFNKTETEILKYLKFMMNIKIKIKEKKEMCFYWLVMHKLFLWILNIIKKSY